MLQQFHWLGTQRWRPEICRVPMFLYVILMVWISTETLMIQASRLRSEEQINEQFVLAFTILYKRLGLHCCQGLLLRGVRGADAPSWF